MSKLMVKVHEATKNTTAALTPEEVSAIHDACVEYGLREKVSPGNLFIVFFKNEDEIRIYPYNEHGDGLSIKVAVMSGSDSRFLTPDLQVNCFYADYMTDDLSRIVPKLMRHLCDLLKARDSVIHSYYYLCR